MKIKGAHFITEPLPDGEVRITWSDGPDKKPEPLDFWIVPADEVEASIAKVREGFEL
jgi:hypothetical protein